VKHLDDYEVIRSMFPWERRKVGVEPPPIKTDLGWLVIYHGVSIESIYRAGAILLDLDNPSKVLARTKEPILEPEMEFEYGVVSNVVFPDGAIVQYGKLMVYYGGPTKSVASPAHPSTNSSMNWKNQIRWLVLCKAVDECFCRQEESKRRFRALILV
jgi:predicted GH43/DUF377 family glycosyl hydrolase